MVEGDKETAVGELCVLVEVGGTEHDVCGNASALEAARKLEEIISTKGADRVPIEVCDGLATKLEEHADFDRALDMLEIVRRRDATYPNVATRIESLRKRRSKNQRNTGDENFGTGDTCSSEYR